MFGDVPDPTVTTPWVGFGTTSGRARGVRCTVQRGFRGLAVVSGLCRKLWAERREERETRRLFPETENVRRLTGYYCRYIYPLGRQTDSKCDET